MTSPRRILIIDDEPDVVDYLSAVLSDEGYTVVPAYNGPDGLALAEAETPDLITLDITMPGMSGIEVLTNLRRDPHLADIPVLIVTGVSDFKRLMDYREVRPPEGFIQKPIDLVMLLSSIKKLLEPVA